MKSLFAFRKVIVLLLLLFCFQISISAQIVAAGTRLMGLKILTKPLPRGTWLHGLKWPVAPIIGPNPINTIGRSTLSGYEGSFGVAAPTIPDFKRPIYDARDGILITPEMIYSFIDGEQAIGKSNVHDNEFSEFTWLEYNKMAIHSDNYSKFLILERIPTSTSIGHTVNHEFDAQRNETKNEISTPTVTSKDEKSDWFDQWIKEQDLKNILEDFDFDIDWENEGDDLYYAIIIEIYGRAITEAA